MAAGRVSVCKTCVCVGTKCPAEWRHEDEDMYSNLSRVLSIEYFESSMESHTQALSILSRVWKVILDTRLIVEYLPDTVLILE